MNQLQFDARVSWTAESIVSDWTLTGHPPGHSECKWSNVEAWGVGRPEPAQVEGLWLLIKDAPYYYFVSSRSVGALALEGELRRRGCPEHPVTLLKQQADERAFRDLRAEVGTLFGEDAAVTWQLLENAPSLRWVNVRTAVVRLSKGDRARLEQLVDTASKDYRDVLMWAQAEHLI